MPPLCRTQRWLLYPRARPGIRNTNNPFTNSAKKVSTYFLNNLQRSRTSRRSVFPTSSATFVARVKTEMSLGAKSRGPKTDTGTARSAVNANKHNPSSRLVVPNNENDEAFQQLFRYERIVSREYDCALKPLDRARAEPCAAENALFDIDLVMSRITGDCEPLFPRGVWQ